MKQVEETTAPPGAATDGGGSRDVVYSGDRVPKAAGGANVTYNHGFGPQSLPVRLDVRNHSPDGFQWGYGGSGPAQLALALCIHALDGDKNRALRVYQDFKFKVVAKLPDAWTLTRSQILGTIDEIEAAK